MLGVVANQVSLSWGLFVGAAGAALQVYDLWPRRWPPGKVCAAGSVLGFCTLLIVGVPMILRGEVATLYYDERELNGAKITFGINPDPRFCMVMHVWAAVQPGPPNSFALCGIWMKKPKDEGKLTELYWEFSESVQVESMQGCSLSPEKPKRKDFKVAFICQMWTSRYSTQTRWYLVPFFGKPIPTKDTKVRLRFPYGNNRKADAEAEFILQPPDPGQAPETAQPSPR